MAPSAVADMPALPAPSHNGSSEHHQTSYLKPLKLSGALDRFKFEETTPLLGREFLDVDIVDDLLSSDHADERLRDLAITSKLYHRSLSIPLLTTRQSPNAASSSSARSIN